MSKLTATELFKLFEGAIASSGMVAKVLSHEKPYRFGVQFSDGRTAILRVYLWNCTHGGGAARADDEYRIQVTGVVPYSATGEIALLLGWHENHQVFVAWDMLYHEGQNSNSPSTQVREDILMAAATSGVASGIRGNGEYVVAFRSDCLERYLLNMSALHRGH
ncbi:hypothetical protein ACM9W9_19025 [Xanthomonas sacchari]